MLKRAVRGMSMAAIMLVSALAFSQGQPASGVKSGYAQVNGLKMYYEVHGTGQPLILLHGGVGSTGMFSEIMPALASSREVIALDLQAHGRTADIARPLSYEAMADDVAALMKTLEIKQADVMGYSLGGGVALRTAIQHPELVRKLVVVSAPFKRHGWYPEIQAAMSNIDPANAENMKQSPMYQVYASSAPRPQDWPQLFKKLSELLGKDYDWSKEVAAIKVPILLVVGDADAVRPAHAVEFFELLGGGKRDAGWDGAGMSDARLAILPGTTHYNIFASPLLATTANAFLDAPLPARK